MENSRIRSRMIRRASTLAVAALGLLSFSPVASAAQFELIYNGYFNSADALNLASAPDPVNFAGQTAFTLRAAFDDSSPNVVGGLPFPGFVAYSPYRATIDIGGVRYSVAGYNENPTAGITVTIFDETNIFEPGRYGVGFIQDPVADGAGIVADFLSASPNFTVGNLTPTTFVDYQGAGFLAGVGGLPTPLVLRNGGQVYSLTIGNRIEEYSEGAPLNTAQLQAIPEPGTLGLGGAALAILVVLRRRKA